MGGKEEEVPRGELVGLDEVDEIEGREERGIECGLSGSREGEESERKRGEKSAALSLSLAPSRMKTKDAKEEAPKEASPKKNEKRTPELTF